MTSGSAARAVAERMADAASALLSGLDGGARQRARWEWSDVADAERRRWFYTPTDHGGLPLAALSARQYRRTMALVASGLSEAAYVSVATIMGWENVLDRAEDFAGFDFARDRGRDPLQYRIRIFGTPGADVWGWRFGGHHVSLNNLVVAGELVSSTPCFLGADPATAALPGGVPLRPLGGTEELGRALVHSLDPAQRDRAVLTSRAPLDVVSANRSRTGPGDRVVPLNLLFRGRFADPAHDALMARAHEAGEEHYGLTPADDDAVTLTEHPLGIPASELTAEQRSRLLAVLDCYTGRVPDELAEREAARYAGPLLDQVHFAWAGSLEPGDACYYRLQGPRLLVEYDNAQRLANHAHAVWRDPDGDFGGDIDGDLLAAHHRTEDGRDFPDRSDGEHPGPDVAPVIR